MKRKSKAIIAGASKLVTEENFILPFVLWVSSFCRFNIFGTDVHYDFVRLKAKRKVEKVQIVRLY